MARMCQHFEVLNYHLMSISGALGDATIFPSVMGNCGCTTSIGLASGFHQVQLVEKDKYITAFHDEHGELWELDRYGIGLKTLPAACAARVGAALGGLKGK